MDTLRLLLISVATLLAATGSGLAQRSPGHGVPQAVAVVQAPEAAVEICHASTPQSAHDCALARCQKKAGRGACYSITTCAPSGWTGIMGVKVKEVHFSETVCGAPSKEAALAALKAFCRGHLPSLEQCHVEDLWAPNGKVEKVGITWSPADLAKQATQ